jgi:hypothetical protein
MSAGLHRTNMPVHAAVKMRCMSLFALELSAEQFFGSNGGLSAAAALSS